MLQIMVPFWIVLVMLVVVSLISYLIMRLIQNHKIAMVEQDSMNQHALMQQQLENEREKLRQHLAEAEEKRTQARVDFENLANRIFDAKQKQFGEQSRETLDLTMRPLKQQIEGFRKRVDEIHSTDTADRNRLKGQIEELQKQSQRIGNDAVALANALKGESKTQGNWGEIVLEKILEESGLHKGREYETQVSLKNEEGNRRSPDVIVHLPEGKDIVVDAKVSLSAYERYCSLDDQEKATALREHIASLRTHIKGLSGKSYHDLEGLKTLDFVLMFVPIEPAFMLALEHDPSLFSDAYDKNIILVCPTTLLATLRTIQSIWRYEKQNRNALEIAERAGKLHDHFVLFVDALDDVGKHLDRSVSSYETARKRLVEGQGNLVKRSDDLRQLGAKAQKQLPESVRSVLDDSEDGRLD